MSQTKSTLPVRSGRCLIVQPNASLIIKDINSGLMTIVKEGFVITPAGVNVLAPEVIDELIQSRKVAWGDSNDGFAEGSRPTGDMPGANLVPFRAAKDGKDAPAIDRNEVATSPTVIPPTSAPATSPKNVDASKWVVDPASISSHTLDQLNAMVKDRDAKVDAFEDVNEARAFLSQDFKPKE